MTTLTSLLLRLRGVLMDAVSAVWDDDTLTEGLRLALGEYGLAGNQTATVAGLDGASATSLDPLHESLIVWGAAGCCALARAANRAESYQPGSDPGALQSWGEQRLKEFKTMLGAVFPAYRLAADGSAGGAAADPARAAAEIALLYAQSAALTGQEARAEAAAAQSAQDRADEAARRADLRYSADAAWGGWPDRRNPHYPADYERS